MMSVFTNELRTELVTMLDGLTWPVTSSNVSDGETIKSSPQYVVDVNVPDYLRDVYMLIGSVGAAGNLLVFIILIRYVFRKNSTMTEGLLLHQAFADELTSIFVIVAAAHPPPSSYSTSPSVWEDFLCRVWATQLPLWASFSVSNFNLVAITFEQYFRLVHPLFHKTKLSHIKTPLPIFLVWFCALTCNILDFVPGSGISDGVCLAWGKYPNLAASGAAGVAAILYYLVIPASMMTGCFCHMAYKMHKKSNQTAPVGVTSTFGQVKTSILKTLILFEVTFVVCWSYNIWVWMLALFNAIEASFYTTWMYHISVLILFLSCSINPFIYALNYKKFRRGFRRYLDCCIKLFGSARARETINPASDGDAININALGVQSTTA